MAASYKGKLLLFQHTSELRLIRPAAKLGAKAKALAVGAGKISAHDPVRGLKSKMMSEGLKVHYPGLPAFAPVIDPDPNAAVPEPRDPPQNVSHVPEPRDPPQNVPRHDVAEGAPEPGEPSQNVSHGAEPADEPAAAAPADEPEPVPEPAGDPPAPSSSSMDHDPHQWHDWTPMIPYQWGDWNEYDWENDDESWGVWNAWGREDENWQEWTWTMSNRERWASEHGFKRKRGGSNKEFFAQKYGRW